MSLPDEGNGEKEMEDAVRLREARQKRWEEEGERSLWQNLSMIGALGWQIVTPTLIGIFLGRWLDQLLGTGIMFSAAFIFLGLALGCFLAWRWIKDL